MSNLVVSDVGENLINDAWALATSSEIWLSLYQNNYTPVAGSVYASFTPCTFTGYARQQPVFGASATVGGKGTMTDTSPRAFVMGVPGTTNVVYGYYVWLDVGVPGNEILIYAEKFDAPQTMANHFDEIDVTLVFTLYSEF